LGRQRLEGQGRLVIRPSGTEPVIRVMAEGDNGRLVQQVVGEIVAALRKVAEPA
jgi:phosphoglucosamine mutase